MRNSSYLIVKYYYLTFVLVISRVYKIYHTVSVEISYPNQRHLSISRQNSVRLVLSQAVHLVVVKCFLNINLVVALVYAVGSCQKQIWPAITIEIDESI